MADDNKITIADFQIEGMDDLIKETGELIALQEKLRKDQKELKKSSDELTESGQKRTEALAVNQARLKTINKEIQTNTKLLQANTTATLDLDAAIDKQINSENEAIANIKELTQARRDLQVTDENYERDLARINTKIDQNNAFIDENVSQLEQQKRGIGDYAGGIREALKDQDLFAGSNLNLDGALGQLSSTGGRSKRIGGSFYRRPRQ